jgi:phosphoglycolate phosphatase
MRPARFFIAFGESTLLGQIGKASRCYRPRVSPAILFDLDGTLVDSLADIRASMNDALVRSGFPEVSLETYRALIGDGVRDLAARAAGTTDEAVIDTLVTDFAAAYALSLCNATAPYEGIPQVLARLAKRRVRLGVLTNKPDAAAQAIVLTLFPGVFGDVRGHAEGAPKKPDPATLLTQIARLGVTPDKALFIGDSEVDVATARAAQVRCIAVSYGYRDVGWLADADEVVDSVNALDLAIDRWLVVMGLPSDQDRAP